MEKRTEAGGTMQEGGEDNKLHKRRLFKAALWLN